MKLLSRSVAILALGLTTLFLGGLNAGEKKVKVGDKAPAIESIDDQGKPWKSTDVVGKKILVVYFYPADFTGGCTSQACSFRDDIEKLHGQGVEVVGVSGDSAATHKLFKNYHKLNFTLLADEKGAIAKLFGVPVTKGGTIKGIGFDETGTKIDVTRGSTIQRYTVVIAKNGTVVAIDQVSNAKGDSQRIADMVKKMEAK
jgi:peroxiredoxin Q/BCP